MRRLMAMVAAGALVLGIAGATTANGESNRNAFKARLGGFQEVPAIVSTGSGSLIVSVNPGATQLNYKLTFSNLQGGTALASHIHIGQPGVNGSVAAFLCGGGGKPACPAGGGTVTGTIVAADVLAIPAQGLAAGDLAGLLRAMRAGVTYANVHTTSFPAGEIRGQIGGRGNGQGENN